MVWLCRVAQVVLGRVCWLAGHAPLGVSGADLAGALRPGVRFSEASANPLSFQEAGLVVGGSKLMLWKAVEISTGPTAKRTNSQLSNLNCSDSVAGIHRFTHLD